MIVYYLAPMIGRTLEHRLSLLPALFVDADGFGSSALTGLGLTQALAPSLFTDADSFGTAATLTLGSAPQFLAPSLFSSSPGFGPAVLVLTMLDPVSMEAGLTLSNSNLTVVLTTAVGHQLVRANRARSSGKRWFAVRMDGTDPAGQWPWGLVPSGFAGVPGDGPTMGWYRGGPNTIYSNSGPVPVNYLTAAMGLGDWMMVCVDLDARLLWAKPSTAGASWNGSGDPATGLNGAAFHASVATPLYPAISLVTIGNSATFNFGASAAPVTVPAGFVSWDAP